MIIINVFYWVTRLVHHGLLLLTLTSFPSMQRMFIHHIQQMANFLFHFSLFFILQFSSAYTIVTQKKVLKFRIRILQWLINRSKFAMKRCFVSQMAVKFLHLYLVCSGWIFPIEMKHLSSIGWTIFVGMQDQCSIDAIVMAKRGWAPLGEWI